MNVNVQQSSPVYPVILAAVDLGPASQSVVERSLSWAERLGAAVELVHVHEGVPAYAPDALVESTLTEVLDSLRAHALEHLNAIKASSPPVRSARVFIGQPLERIFETAGATGADLVCIGSHRDEARGLLLPNRCVQILHRADRDVLVLKVDGRMQPTEDYGHILAALDFSDAARITLSRAGALARAFGSRLTLAHVIDHFPIDRSNEVIAPEDQDPLDYEQNRSAEQLHALARDAGIQNYGVQVLVSDSTAKRDVAAFAQANQVDLVVVGSHGRHGVEALLGSVAIGTVHRARCDVLVVRASPVAG